MNDADGVTVKLAELLRHPDDLDKIPALKAEFTRKKVAVDGQLKLELKEQLDVTNNGMGSITEGQRVVGQIKDEMMKIDKLCAEAQGMIKDFPNINIIAQTHRNFSQVEKMKANLESFNDRLGDVERMQRQDRDNPEEMPNLLPIHFELSKLRNIREEAMDQIRKAEDVSLQGTLEDYFSRLDDIIMTFDETFGLLCLGIMENVMSDREGLVVRMAIIIEEEERNDRKAKALQQVRKEHEYMASRMMAFVTGTQEVRGYKEKMLECIQIRATERMDQSVEKFREEPEKLDKALRWFFNELNAAKMGLTKLMPKKWRIETTYASIYHDLMHDTLTRLIDKDTAMTPIHELAIIDWVKPYYEKMRKLGFEQTKLQPHVIDNREDELIRRWWQKVVDELNNNLAKIHQLDSKQFRERLQANNLAYEDQKPNTTTFIDVWRMFNQMISTAISAHRPVIVEAVVDAAFIGVKDHQSSWEARLMEECKRHASASQQDQGDFLGPTQEYLIAVANDQMRILDSPQGPGLISELVPLFQNEVSDAYIDRLPGKIEEMENVSVDVANGCINKVVETIFVSDFAKVFSTFFTERWIHPDSQYVGMPGIMATIKDYSSDYRISMHPDMLDIFNREIINSLLFHFLKSMRNKGIKFRRDAPFGQRFRQDLLNVFEWIDTAFAYPEEAKLVWKPVSPVMDLLVNDKALLPDAYEALWQLAPDVPFSWVEVVLKTRDDWDRSTIAAVRARANSMPSRPDRVETVLGRLK